MAALDTLNAMLLPDAIDQTLAAQQISNAAIFVSLYPDIPADRIELAKALYAGHLLSQSGQLQSVTSQSFDGGSVSYQVSNTGDKEGTSTWMQEFLKLVPSAYSPGLIL